MRPRREISGPIRQRRRQFRRKPSDFPPFSRGFTLPEENAIPRCPNGENDPSFPYLRERYFQTSGIVSVFGVSRLRRFPHSRRRQFRSHFSFFFAVLVIN
ncbi:hypothetical protein EUGRSUZ_H04485 [Eucalyptus grandis]|uniref:Uncharacterized protein n=2 Tax=Eucalyptus grandis TaxID=71139 RepID=A0ACC3JWB2_EUCGR|nr:hypothetical protein EUGRSUZ_H04485 [Eucalyptus grandis]